MIEIYTQNLDGVWFGLACTKHQIMASSFGFTQQETLGNILTALPVNLPFEVFHHPSTFAKTNLASLKRIYGGENACINFPLALDRFPVYTQKVLKTAGQIPFGYVTTYGSIAKAVGGGPRAVGNIMAANPFPPIVPCHRVVKSDFTLGGYGLGGLKVKLELLCREKKGFQTSKEMKANGRYLAVFPVEYALRNLDLSLFWVNANHKSMQA